jgi:hypothetical protein
VAPEPPQHPRFIPVYTESFDSDRKKLGLAGQNFEHFWRDIENVICDYPWEYSPEVPNSEGIRMYPTRRAHHDIPAMYVYYRVIVETNQVVFLGLGPAWSQGETFSLLDPDGD